MIINAWSDVFKKKYGSTFPENYLCLDTEYTGGSSEKDLVLEIGHAMVSDRKIIDGFSLVLNWYIHPEVSSPWLDYKLNNLRNFMGKDWQLTPDFLKSRGRDPIESLRFYYKLFCTWGDSGGMFVGQNGLTADERMISGAFQRFLGKSWKFPENQYLDTGAIFKATEIAKRQDLSHLHDIVLPHRSESPKEYSRRICSLRLSGLSWKLDKIIETYPVSSAMEKAARHTAGYDAELLHHVMESYRSEITEKVGQDDPQAEYRKAQAKWERDSKKAASVSAEVEDETQGRQTTPEPKQFPEPKRENKRSQRRL